MKPPDRLEDIGFRDPARSAGRLASFWGTLPADVRRGLCALLASSADPDGAAHRLESLRAARPEVFERLTAKRAGLQMLVAVFSYSRFLSEEVIEHPEWLEELAGADELEASRSAEELISLLEKDLETSAAGAALGLSLSLFRRRQALRILLRDVLGYASLPVVTEELSNLADAVLETACRRIRAELVERYGPPLEAGGKQAGFSIVALGKLGGRELNYSSDIDLMFVYSESGSTASDAAISNREFFKKLANQCTELLSAYTAEGICYRVDLRLRPDGKLGEVAISLDGAKSYYANRARDWELQMLIKARVAAGEREPGRGLLEFVQPLIYSSTLDFSAVESVSATRERIGEKLAARRGRGGMDVKLARGGIRDIEFLVQCLQRLHGGREPWVRHGGTMMALFRLRDKNLLSDTEYSRLAAAYQFMRHLEHRLQFDEDRQTHVLPEDRETLELLARRMPQPQLAGPPSAESLLRELNGHLEEVQEMYERVIHAQRPIYYTNLAQHSPDGGVREETGAPAPGAEPVSNLVRFLDQKAAGLAAVLARSGLRRSLNRVEHFLERVVANPVWLSWLDSDPVLAGFTLDLFEHSPYFAEQLIRRPEMLADIRLTRERPSERLRYFESAAAIEDPSDLRRFFRREMLRIQSESICLAAPIFSTLERTSELADATIAAAYRMAVEQTRASRPPASPGYDPGQQMMVIALGRLGMREFDLASDADLVFVLPEADVSESAFWTRVAGRLIEIITAYTGEGVIFAVDTRLRPNGREGQLVQSESLYKEYFEKAAEAWEGITYMKARAVAGNLDRATEFLHNLQELDWRRYGQSGRSRKALRLMRQRVEKEQGAGNPLKAGPGGYYDIDFALMYLRLKGAGIFYKVLNTPERIDVIEKMGHLERADAVFLRDAATLYRAIDHGLRLITGQAEGDLPHSEAQLEMLTSLVTRWTPDHLHDQPLAAEVEQILTRTREYFERLFGSQGL